MDRCCTRHESWPALGHWPCLYSPLAAEVTPADLWRMRRCGSSWVRRCARTRSPFRGRTARSGPVRSLADGPAGWAARLPVTVPRHKTPASPGCARVARESGAPTVRASASRRAGKELRSAECQTRIRIRQTPMPAPEGWAPPRGRMTRGTPTRAGPDELQPELARHPKGGHPRRTGSQGTPIPGSHLRRV
jgi:hypothetical protein